MARAPKKWEPEPARLTAIIETVEQTYYIAQDHPATMVDDEAILDVVGRITEISPSYKAHIREPIEISLLCARRFTWGEPVAPIGRSFLLSMNRRKNSWKTMAYIPADAFWALPSMIQSGAVTHVEARFTTLHRGSGDLLSLYLAPASKLPT